MKRCLLLATLLLTACSGRAWAETSDSYGGYRPMVKLCPAEEIKTDLQPDGQPADRDVLGLAHGSYLAESGEEVVVLPGGKYVILFKPGTTEIKDTKGNDNVNMVGVRGYPALGGCYLAQLSEALRKNGIRNLRPKADVLKERPLPPIPGSIAIPPGAAVPQAEP